MLPTLNQGKCVVKRHAECCTRLRSVHAVCKWELNLNSKFAVQGALLKTIEKQGFHLTTFMF